MSYNYNAHNFKSQDILTGLERKANLIKKKKIMVNIYRRIFFSTIFITGKV